MTRLDRPPIYPLPSTLSPARAVNQTDGRLSGVWSAERCVFFRGARAGGRPWSPALAVSIAPANTALFPWVVAYNGTVDVVYYGTTASSKDDPSANWFTYIAQTTDGVNFTQSRVNNKTNHAGVICTGGTSCQPGTRHLLDLFHVAINPQNRTPAATRHAYTWPKDCLFHPLPH